MKKLKSQNVNNFTVYGEQKAITLISLVITIVVLIILAGVTISLTIGENGIFTRAKLAKEQYLNAQEAEQEKIDNLSKELSGDTSEEIVESGIWRAKKSTEKNSSSVQIYVYSIYYSPTVPDTLNKYKEQYIVKTYNEMLQQEGLDMTFNNLDELVLFIINESSYSLINDFLVANSIECTREEFIVETLSLECETEEYANVMLGQLGYTTEDILEIETEYEENKNNQTTIEIPEEIKTATYIVTYPDGTTEEVLGSSLNSFKGTYNVEDNGNNIITIAKSSETTKLTVAVNNLMKTYTDEWYTYKYNNTTKGYAVKVTDNTLTTYGEIKNDINGIPITSLNSTYKDCKNLTNLSFREFNASNVTNMSDMFYGCSSLTSLDLSNFDTSNVTSMICMFCNCSSLTTLDLSSFNTSNVTNMSGMFSECSVLTSLDLSNFDISNVTNMSNMFNGCSSLTSLDLSNFDISNVTNMSHIFNGCSSLTSLDLSGFDTSNVTNMCSMFWGCSSLTTLDVSGFDTSNVTDMRWMFYNCSALTNLNLSSFNTSNATDMYGMFWRCSSLTSLDLSSFNTSIVTDMSLMFSECRALTSLDLSSFNTSNVTDMSWMFSECRALTTISVGANWTTENATTTNMFYGCGTSIGTNKS